MKSFVPALFALVAALSSPLRADVPELPPEARILPDQSSAKARAAARNVSIAGTAAGIVLAGWGISLVFGGIADGPEGQPDDRGVHRGIAVAVSGGLAASIFSAAAAYYSGPPER